MNTPPEKAGVYVAKYMMAVLIGTVGAAMFIVALALPPTVSTALSAIRDVLPIATGLIGFAGGVVAALFGKRCGCLHQFD